MKKRELTKKEQGKQSSFLITKRRNKASSSSQSSRTRQAVRMNNNRPNSSKVGAGPSVVAIRNVPMGKFKHRKNHRTHETVGMVKSYSQVVNS
jgi:hypothetical protein